MADLIERQAAIDTVAKSALDLNDPDENWIMQDRIKEIPSAQPDLQPTCNQLATDCISRQAAIDGLSKLRPRMIDTYEKDGDTFLKVRAYDVNDMLEGLPSAQPNKEQIKTGEWEMFELITSVYYGKQYYFKQENGIVYSRSSCKYMSVDDAIKEFLDVIGE